MSKLKHMMFCLLLSGCIANDWHTLPRYDFTMTAPEQKQQLAYSDKNIDIVFSIPAAQGKDCNNRFWGCKSFIIYNGISFSLKNKTSEVVILDWNQISFKDYNGRSGNAVMHTGVKYKECYSSKQPSIIPPNGLIDDVITPCYALRFERTNSMDYWQVSMLRRIEEQRPLDFGVFLPIQFGSATTNYVFSFHAAIPNINKQK